jgi:AraC family transcriptional regulator
MCVSFVSWSTVEEIREVVFMNYEQRLQKVFQYIEQHFEENITLDQLSEVACCSKYHFHRIFSALVGMSVHQYIRWLRLRRAAYQLVMEKKRSILRIALDAGFESHESFTRAFKAACDKTPSQLRETMDMQMWTQQPFNLFKKSENVMKVEIRHEDAVRTAAIAHQGDVNTGMQSVDKLISWCKARPENLKPAGGDAYCIAYNDPGVVEPEDFRSDYCMKIPDSLELDEPVEERIIPAGRYAIAVHEGSRDKIADTVYAMYRDWLPDSGEELGDFPCLFSYLNFDDEVPDTALRTEVRLLLKK